MQDSFLVIVSFFELIFFSCLLIFILFTKDILVFKGLEKVLQLCQNSNDALPLITFGTVVAGNKHCSLFF